MLRWHVGLLTRHVVDDVAMNRYTICQQAPLKFRDIVEVRAKVLIYVAGGSFWLPRT